MYNIDHYFDFDSPPKSVTKSKKKKQQQQQMLLLLLLAVAGAYYFMIYLPEEEVKKWEVEIQKELNKVKKLKQDDYDDITTLLGTSDKKLKDITSTLVTMYQEEVNLFPNGDKNPNFHFSRTASFYIHFPPSLKEHYEAGKEAGEINCEMLKEKEDLILSNDIII
ncbi:1991_t:CDS:2 [Funneliformis geosporum]|nr:1991_t:CDS:2 [Funneliformis geosporum]